MSVWRPGVLRAWSSPIWPAIAAPLRFARLSGQLRVPKRMRALAASGVPHERAAGILGAPFWLFHPRGPGHGPAHRIRPGFQERVMTSPGKSRRAEVKDGDQTVAAAEVTTV